ncbi:MAG: endolytic transglycosylase MltG [Clostridia bacterium]|nr:endolytic transglycosylase MltG [Clostridia bacterium]
MKKFIKIALAIAILILIVGLIFVSAEVLGLGKGEDIVVNIPEGVNNRGIVKILENDGIIEHPNIFLALIKLKQPVFQCGMHTLGTKENYFSIIKKLIDFPDAGYDNIVKFTIPEGYEVKDIAKHLHGLGYADYDKFIEEVNTGSFDYAFLDGIDRKEYRLEGYLFPATYEIVLGESEHSIINRMLEAFELNILPLYEESKTEKTLDEVIIMASVVEREAANDEERGKVASVFYNRLEAGMTLSSCATVQYIIGERKDVLSNRDIEIKSPYNTYKNPGLPYGPIASPGVNSVKATLYPEDTDFYYFAATKDGSYNVFTKTGEEHLKTVKELQK